MERYDVAQKIFDYIKAEGFEAYDIRRGNGYFIFDMGEDGVIHFKIKGLHGWLFAMWINLENSENDYLALQFFTQKEKYIDKFKPSRSWFCEKYSYEQIEKMMSGKDYMLYNIADMLKMIKYHPLLSFYYDQFTYSKYVTARSVLQCYLNIVLWNMKANIKQWWCEVPVYWWTKLKAAICKHYKIVDNITITDGNGDGWKTSPRYRLHIHFKQLYFNDKQEEEELKLLNIWFRKTDWDQLSVELTREGHVSEAGKLIWYSYR